MFEACFLFDEGYEWLLMFHRKGGISMEEIVQLKMLHDVEVVQVDKLKGTIYF